jgi:hypothetical protein
MPRCPASPSFRPESSPWAIRSMGTRRLPRTRST